MERHAVTSAVLAAMFVAGLAAPQQQPYYRGVASSVASRAPVGAAQSAFSSSVVGADGRGSTVVGTSGSPRISTTFSYPTNPVQAAAPAPAPAPTSADFFAPAPTPFPVAFANAPQEVAQAPAAAAAPAPAPAPAPGRYPIIPVIRRSEIHDESGQYALGFETGNGIIVEEQGGLRKNLDGEWKDDVVLIKRGSYSYPGPDGKTYRLSYTADETGFHPVADYLPRSVVA